MSWVMFPSASFRNSEGLHQEIVRTALQDAASVAGLLKK